MAPEQVLFNATIVLLPIWLGVGRYIITETKFSSTSVANLVGLGMVLVLIGILFPMWVAVQQLVDQSNGLSTGLFILFSTVSLMGLGGVLFIIKEIEPISGTVVTGIPIGIAIIGIGIVFLSSIIEELSFNSVDLFFQAVTLSASGAVVLSSLYRFREYYHFLIRDQKDET